MKLKYIYLLPLLATAMIGCDEIEYSDAKPVENPQLPEITQADFSVSPSSLLSNGLNLESLSSQTDNPDAYMVQLYTVNVNTNDLPEDAIISGGLELATSSDFSNPFNVGDITISEGVASVPLSSLIYTRSTMFGKDPREYTVYYRIPVYVTVDGGQYKLGDKDFYYCDGDSFKEFGVDPGYTVEEAYYLLGPNGMDLSDAVKFNHSGYNIYDDTVFTLTAKFEEGNSSWLVIPLSVYEAGGSPSPSKVYGPTDAESLTGVLELGGSAGELESGKKYDFTINLSTLSYTISEVADFEYLYTPGNSNGWSQNASQMLSTNDFVNYSGFVYLSGEFKFTSQINWDGINFGQGAEEGTLSTDGGNLNAEPGLYWASVNINELTYSLTPITSISMIGDFNDWGGDVELTPSEDFLTWTGTLTLANAGGWKFRVNNDWAINLGGSDDNLVTNGDNLYNEAGTYTVTLELNKLPYSCSVEAE